MKLSGDSEEEVKRERVIRKVYRCSVVALHLLIKVCVHTHKKKLVTPDVAGMGSAWSDWGNGLLTGNEGYGGVS